MSNKFVSEWFEHNLAGHHLKQDKFQVYITSGGKCGSSTLAKSFRKLTSTLHAHRTSFFFRHHLNWFDNPPFTLADYISYSRIPNKTTYIINSNRDPIARIISSFFHNIVDNIGKEPQEILSMELESIIEIFKLKLNKLERYNGFNIWKRLGVDVYDYEFDKGAGYQVIRSGRYCFINLVIEKVGNWPRVIKENTEFKKFKLVNKNLSAQKWYSDLYRNFLEEIQFTDSEIMDVYGSRLDYLNHHYTQSEIEAWIEMWNGRGLSMT